MSLVFSSISAWFSRSPGQVNISRQKRTSRTESGAGSAVPSHHRLSSWWSTRPRLWNAGLRCEGTLPKQETERGSQSLPEALWNTRHTAAGSTRQVLDSSFTFTQPRTQPLPSHTVRGNVGCNIKTLEIPKSQIRDVVCRRLKQEMDHGLQIPSGHLILYHWMTTTEANLTSNVTFQELLYNKRVCLLLALKRWNSSTMEELYKYFSVQKNVLAENRRIIWKHVMR